MPTYKHPHFGDLRYYKGTKVIILASMAPSGYSIHHIDRQIGEVMGYERGTCRVRITGIDHMIMPRCLQEVTQVAKA